MKGGTKKGIRVCPTSLREGKLMRNKSREGEELYKHLLERTRAGLAIIQEGKFKFVNPGMLRITGYSYEEMIDSPYQKFVPTDELDAVVDRYSRRRGGKDVVSVYEAKIKGKDGKKIDIEVNGGLITYQGKPADLVILHDISERVKVEKSLRETLIKLRKAFGATIQALISVVEYKDPYTAGHQRRVSDLARSIAEEIGLAKKKIDGLRMAASIHDLGKVTIPSEILSKPGRLTDHEMRLVKTHPLVGYEILRKIKFPWPIARVIYEHHERIDGSGYPQGLKGDEISLEAFILGVADVIEAMISHRPYRPALSLERGLDEISNNRGRLYDEGVVDSCLRLFRDKGYQLK